MKSELIFSIIIPVYNAEKHLNKTLDSIFNAGIESYEIIAIDDGSFDNSWYILQQYEKEHTNLKAYHIENGGVSNARNYGLTKATGKYIYFMDSDDSLENGAFSAFSEQIQDFDMVVFGFKKIFTANNEVCLREFIDMNLIGADAIAGYLNGMQIADKDLFLNYLWNRFFKCEIIKKNNIVFDTTLSLGEDFSFICEYIKNCTSIKLIKQACYNYFVRNNYSLSQKFLSNEDVRRKKMQAIYSSLLEHFNCDESAYKTFRIIEGGACLIGVKKILAKNCTLTKKEKKAYLSRLLDFENKRFIIEYCGKQSGKKNRIYGALVKKGNIELLYQAIRLLK